MVPTSGAARSTGRASLGAVMFGLGPVTAIESADWAEAEPASSSANIGSRRIGIHPIGSTASREARPSPYGSLERLVPAIQLVNRLMGAKRVWLKGKESEAGPGLSSTKALR